MSSNPMVSAITIFMNEETFIREAIESVLAQTYDVWELLLVDDGSSDGSTDIAMRYASEHPDRIRYLEHEDHQNRGMSAARNLGIRHARGKYVAFLDADDVWLPQKLEQQVPILESAPEIAMVYGATQYWHSWTGLPGDADRDHVPDAGVPLETRFEPPTLLELVYPLGQGAAPCMCSLLIRADALRSIGGFEEMFRGFYEDNAFLSKVYLNHTVFVSAGCWDRYRIHPRSCSALVRARDQYDTYRELFLRWLKEYIEMRGEGDSGVHDALDAALSQYDARPGRAGPVNGPSRLFRVTVGNAARLVFPADNLDMVRIEITAARTEEPYDIQLSYSRLGVESGHRYSLSFLARADQPRSIDVGFAKGHAPWTNLGLYERIALTAEWRSYEREFFIADDEDNGRIHFDVGISDVSVDIATVTLRSLSDGRFVRPGATAAPFGRDAASNAPTEPDVEFGLVQFGSFRRVTPISRNFGYDRGLPIDRYYVERFLASYADDVRGRVLEIGDRTYTQRFGGDRVSVSDVLHVIEGDPEATIIADLASADHIQSESFDCIILTQTLQLIYDASAAVRTLHRILKPGGVLLATFPGISQTYDKEWGKQWYWNLTTASATWLFKDVFAPAHVQLESFGNVLAAISFLHGLAVEELTSAELDYRDPGYDVTITVRATKPL